MTMLLSFRQRFSTLLLLATLFSNICAFAPKPMLTSSSLATPSQQTLHSQPSLPQGIERQRLIQQNQAGLSQMVLSAGAIQDLDVIGLVAGQENYGLAIVCVGEALWSFLKAPSFSHAKVLVPAAIAAVVLGFVSGPMITSGNADSVSTGLWIATGVSVGLGVSYVARILAPFSPSPKEIAGLGLLVAIAGFFSFGQNLVVDGFVTLPSIPLPSLPDFPDFSFDETEGEGL